LSLLSQKKAEGSLKIYIYIITGGVGSLLAFFLLQRSLPINKQQAKEYYQAVQIAEQAILELDKELIKFQYSHVQPNNSLNLQLTNTKKAISNLQSIPSFYSQAEANILNSKLETQIELLSSQSKLIEQQQVANAKLEQACVNITQLKDELIANPKLLSSYLLANNELNSLTNEVLNITVTYCHDTDDDLVLKVKSNNLMFH
jgi:hypothetical protein